MLENPDCPPVLNGCDCYCHQMAGVEHIMPCCPEDEEVVDLSELVEMEGL